MYEDHYSDEDEKVNTKSFVYYYNNLENILDSSKKKIKNYYRVDTHISQKDLNKLYEGKDNTSVTLFTNKPEPVGKDFNYLTKDRSNIPSVIYLTREHFNNYLKHQRSNINLKITFSKEQFWNTLKEFKKINKKIDTLFNDLRDIKDDFNILVNREYDKFISSLMQYSSKTPMLETKKQKDFKVIKNLINQKQKVRDYYQTLVYLKGKQIYDLLKKCTQGKTKGDFNLEFNPKSRLNTFPFILFFTKRQQKYYYMWLKNRLIFEISMSNTQFHKTYFATIL